MSREVETVTKDDNFSHIKSSSSKCRAGCGLKVTAFPSSYFLNSGLAASPLSRF